MGFYTIIYVPEPEPKIFNSSPYHKSIYKIPAMLSYLVRYTCKSWDPIFYKSVITGSETVILLQPLLFGFKSVWSSSLGVSLSEEIY